MQFYIYIWEWHFLPHPNSLVYLSHQDVHREASDLPQHLLSRKMAVCCDTLMWPCLKGGPSDDRGRCGHVTRSPFSSHDLTALRICRCCVVASAPEHSSDQSSAPSCGILHGDDRSTASCSFNLHVIGSFSARPLPFLFCGEKSLLISNDVSNLFF